MQEAGFLIDQSFIASANEPLRPLLEADYAALGKRLSRHGVDIEAIMNRVKAFEVAVPSWGAGTGGTRFARFPGGGEPRGVFEKLVDCAMIHRLTRATPRVALHIPWDKPEDPPALAQFAKELGLGFDAMNSNTFQDQPGQRESYKFGSLSHTDAAVRRQAIDHNLECVAIGKTLGSHALSIWIGDGGNFPGQMDTRKSLERYLASAQDIYAALPRDWRLFIEYKLYEPAFYSTVINDWGTAYYAVQRLGEQASVLVDLGHHAPNVNIEMIVARLLHFGKLGGFHFNDSKYGDDDLDAGSIKPFQLFLIFHELVNASLEPQGKKQSLAYMLDQSHNVTDPLESLISSTEELQRAYAQALLVDRARLAGYQEANDAIMALKTLKAAFVTDVTPIMQMARYKMGGAIDPIGVYRASGYRKKKSEERPAANSGGSGIV